MRKSKLKENLNTIDKSYIYKLYIEDNKSHKEMQEILGITSYSLDRLLESFNIHKSRTQSSKAVQETKYKKYGNKASYDSYVEKKKEKTIIDKYGSIDKYNKLRSEKQKKTCIERYGYKSFKTFECANNCSELYSKLWNSYEESFNYLKSFLNKPDVYQLSELLNCSINSVHLWIEKYNLSIFVKNVKSGYEDEIQQYLESLNVKNIIKNDRKILNGLELDFYLPDYKIAIEFNGNYTHCSLHKGTRYHFNKSFKCEEKGIRLIHIYQYQWDDKIKKEIIKSIIKNALGKNDNIIYARKCEIRELSKKDVYDFSNKNSLHSHRNASIYLGLFYNDELVQLMSFGKAFFSRDNSFDYECIRSITKINTTVIGGMNKLFKYFINKYNAEKILYYVDYNTHNGNSMDKIGFKFCSYSKAGIINIANSKDVRDKYGYIFNRKPHLNKEISKLIKEGKILTIYDAGVKKYIWSKN